MMMLGSLSRWGPERLPIRPGPTRSFEGRGSNPCEDITCDWVKAVESGNEDNAIFERGEWCVCLFEGVKRRKIQFDGVEQREHRDKMVDDPAELQRLREKGDQMLDSYSASIPDPRAVMSMDAPHVDMTPQEKPVTQEPVDVIRHLLNREGDK